ncbi:MAG: phospholipase D-like domain-containing protein [Planctomycetota bacterium]|jgi:putative cardiolipin synthase
MHHVKAARTLSVCVLLAICGCKTLPPRPPTPEVRALSPATAGALAEAAAALTSMVPAGHSGFLLLDRNDEALKWRLALIDSATTSIDAQYFIWDSDAAARLLFDRLLRAADRGVRVRLLVDDLPFAKKDRDIAAISMHPHFDVAIFNPIGARRGPIRVTMHFLFNLRELNRRMHNKLLIVDNRAAIFGGRNIGNAYFGLSKKYNFLDLDVIVMGPVVEEASEAFDEYWNADLSYPGIAMSRRARPEDIPRIRENTEKFLVRHRDLLVSYPVERTLRGTAIRGLPYLMETGEAHIIQDEPVRFGEENLRLVDMLASIASPTDKEFLIGTPYLIPDQRFLDAVKDAALRGIKVRIITNSLGSNNHTPVHSHYKKYRRRLLDAGAELYEFRHDPSSAVRSSSDVHPVRAKFTSLHMKVLVSDDRRCFIGSLNQDPRAVTINTENGLYIKSPQLSKRVADDLRLIMSGENAWHAYLDDRGRLRWKSASGTVIRQPARHFGQRIADFFFRLMPIEKHL